MIAGRGHGRLLEFPTANLDPGRQVVPGDGVYAGWAEVAGRRYRSAVSIGNKPTLGPAERTIEAFLIDAKGDYYDEWLDLALVRRLRGQVRFDDAERLRAQIAKDVERVREICG